MALTAEDLNNIGRLFSGFATKSDMEAFPTKADLKKELTGFATKADLTGFATKDDLIDGLSGLRSEMHDGFENILDTLNEHIIDTDRRFMSDRKRLERLEKIVL